MKGKTLLIALLIVNIAIPLPMDSAAGEGIPVTAVEIQTELATHPEEKIKSLITMRVGDHYTPEALEKAQNELIKTALFETVEAEAIPSGGGVKILWRLKEAQLVRRVSVSGNYPFLGKKIIRLSSLQPGDPYQEYLVTESEDRIRDFFEKEGYHRTKVEIRETFNEEKHVANLKIKINKGSVFPLGETYYEGNDQLSDKTVHGKLFSFNRFKMRKLKKRIKRLQDYYINKGFVRSRVKLQSVETDIAEKEVDVEIAIQERKKLVLHFDGIGWFKPQTLKNQTVFERERSYDRIAIERSAEKIKAFYLVNGFLGATVDWTLEDEDDRLTVFFTINEGNRTYLKNIDLKGNKSYRTRKITKIMESKPNGIFSEGYYQEANLEPDFERIARFYKDHGFFDIQITHWEVKISPFGDQATLIIYIKEGERYQLKDIHITGNRDFDLVALLKKSGLKSDKYENKKIKKAREKLTQFYLDKGYAYAEIGMDEAFDLANHSVDLTVSINEGPPVRVGNIVISGEFLTHEKIIRNTLKIKEGDIFRYKKMLDAQLNLKRLGIFDHVRVTPMGYDEKRESVDLVVNIQERKSLTLDIQGGYDSDKRFSGELIITKRNLFGRAKQIQLRGVGGQELFRGEATFFSPRVYGASWNLVNQYFAQYEDDENFNATSYGGSLGTLKNFGPDWTLLLKEQITRFNIFEDESNLAAISSDNLFDSTFSELAFSMVMDTRDNFADPQSGVYALLSSEFDTDLSNLENNFNITKFSASHYLGFAKRMTLVNSIRVGNIFDMTSAAQIPVNKLFFMGGNDTIRGFNEDTVRQSGGTTSLLYNIELQLQIYDNLKVAGFLDMGSLTNRFTEITWDNFREGGGGGLRYITPVGPIRVDYGFILDRKGDEQLGRFHLSFGYYF